MTIFYILRPLPKLDQVKLSTSNFMHRLSPVDDKTTPEMGMFRVSNTTAKGIIVRGFNFHLTFYGKSTYGNSFNFF